MSESVITKRCSKCNSEKPVVEFFKNHSNKDGYHYWCKRCDIFYAQSKKGKQAAKRYFQSKRAKKIRKEYRRTSKMRFVRNEQKKRYRRRNPQKIKAQKAVTYAIKSGRLPKPSNFQCSRSCGNQAQEYHHFSYLSEDWLNVIPVCQICHRFLDKQTPTYGISY